MKQQQRTTLLDERLLLTSWAKRSGDYRLVIAALRMCDDRVSVVLPWLSQINKALVDESEGIFDGTMTSLRRLVNKGKLKVSNLADQSLRAHVETYLSEDSLDPKDISQNRWHPQAMKSKAVTIGLYLNAGKLTVTRDSPHTIRMFEKLNDDHFPINADDVREGRLDSDAQGMMTIINTLWASLCDPPQSKVEETLLSDFVVEQAIVGSGMIDQLLNTSLGGLVDEIASKELVGNSDGHELSYALAVRHAFSILVIDAARYIPANAPALDLKIDGFLFGPVRYFLRKKVNSQLGLRSIFVKNLQQDAAS